MATRREGGARSGRGARSAGTAKKSTGGRRPAAGARQYASRGAARTGAVKVAGEPARKPQKTLGGEQVEGRQAVRELLIAGNRKVREVWVATDLDDNEVVGDIVEIARTMRVPVAAGQPQAARGRGAQRGAPGSDRLRRTAARGRTR